MILHHVSGSADAVVVSRPGTNTDVLGHRDLYVVDVVGVPNRLEHLVGKSQRQNILHRFFTQIVIDAKNFVRGKDSFYDLVEFDGAFQVVTEGLFDHHAPPPVWLWLGETGAG